MSLIEGKNGWVFVNEHDQFGFLDKEWKQEDVDRWLAITQNRIKVTNSINNGDFATIIAPEKSAVYGINLPDGVSVHDKRLSTRLAEYNPATIYPVDKLSKQDTNTYEPLESHWNDYGAWLAYLELCKILTYLSGWDIPRVTHATFSRGPDKGTTDLGPGGDRWHYNKVLTQGKVIFNNLIVGRGNVKVSVNDDPDVELPSLVLFRDSFVSAMMPFLVRSFRRIVSVNSWHYLDEIVESERPDFVVMEVCERYLTPVPYEIEPDSFESFCKMTVEQVNDIGRS